MGIKQKVLNRLNKNTFSVYQTIIYYLKLQKKKSELTPNSFT